MSDSTASTATKSGDHQSPDYVDDCMHVEAAPQPWTEPVSVLALRKDSCETQWDTIKKRFMSWKENGQKKYTI